MSEVGGVILALMQAEPATDAIVSWLERISQVGFGVLMALLLFGHWMGIWVWGREMTRRVAEMQAQLAQCEARIARAEAEAREWKDMVFGLLPPLEAVAQRLPRRG